MDDKKDENILYNKRVNGVNKISKHGIMTSVERPKVIITDKRLAIKTYGLIKTVNILLEDIDQIQTADIPKGPKLEFEKFSGLRNLIPDVSGVMVEYKKGKKLAFMFINQNMADEFTNVLKKAVENKM